MVRDGIEVRCWRHAIGLGGIVGPKYIQLVSEIQPPEVTLDFEHFL